MRAKLTAALLAVVLAGCSVERLPASEPPGPGPTSSPASRAGPTAAPSLTFAAAEPVWPLPGWPAVEIPAGDVRAEAVVEERGVRLRLVLERNPMPAGEPTWVTTELTNTGPDQLVWSTDGCATHVMVLGELTSHEWHDGVPQAGWAAEFKRNVGQSGSAMRLDFTPEAFVGIGDYGCADLAVEHRLPPGEAIVLRARWDGLIWRAGLPPTAEAVVSATFQGWRREREGVNRRRELKVELATWVAGSPDAPLMSAREAADFALRDPRLASWIRNVWIRRGNTIDEFDPARGVWHIGLAMERNGRNVTEARFATVDPATGRVLGVVDALVDGSGEITIVGPVQ
jgi:hypothetical protein